MKSRTENLVLDFITKGIAIILALFGSFNWTFKTIWFDCQKVTF